MSLRKAAEMALQQLQRDDVYLGHRSKTRADAIEALRQALAQPDLAKVGEVGVWGNSQALEEPANSTTDFVEPVAYIEKHKDYLAVSADSFENAIPVYTAPPKREWVGLTDEERHDIREWQEIQKELGPVWAPMMLYLYVAIEAKLKEKNHG